MQHTSLPDAMEAFSNRYRLLTSAENVIVAVSGGLDSMALLHLLSNLSAKLQFHLAVAHFNHQLRGTESDEDEAFVRDAAKTLKLEFYVERSNTAAIAESRKLSIQEAARDQRYAFLQRLRNSLGFQKIATAHHANDNAETILFNIIRGAGVHGLSGIPVVRYDLSVVRPLLFALREEIESYATSQGIKHREDSSNVRTEYTRNYLRLSLIPEIQRNINPNIVGTLARTSEIFKQLEEYLNEEVSKHFVDVIQSRTARDVVFDLVKLHSKPVFLQEYMLLHATREFTGMEIDFSTIKAILKISHAETGSSGTITKDIVAFKDRGHLVLKQIVPTVAFRHSVKLGKGYALEQSHFSSTLVPSAELNTDPNVEFVDAGLLNDQLWLRSWNDGDWFIPLGMHDRKKVSDFFVDAKIPVFQKRMIPILTSGDEIVWICGKRLDDRFKITATTKRIAKLEYSPSHQPS